MMNNPPPVIYLESVESTNQFAQDLLKSHQVIHGTVITAKEQLKGRGQRGNHWHSNPGENITLSIILLPERLNVQRHFNINMSISLGVRDFLLQCGISNPEVKWPNDIIYDQQKLAGILIENAIRGDIISTIVAGIGINMNQTVFNSTGFNLPPVSVKLITGQNNDIESSIHRLSDCVIFRYNQLMQHQDTMLSEEYKASLFRLNKHSQFTNGNKTFEGMIIDVSEEGMLIIKENNGSISQHSFTEIKLLF